MSFLFIWKRLVTYISGFLAYQANTRSLLLKRLRCISEFLHQVKFMFLLCYSKNLFYSFIARQRSLLSCSVPPFSSILGKVQIRCTPDIYIYIF